MKSLVHISKRYHTCHGTVTGILQLSFIVCRSWCFLLTVVPRISWKDRLTMHMLKSFDHMEHKFPLSYSFSWKVFNGGSQCMNFNLVRLRWANKEWFYGQWSVGVRVYTLQYTNKIFFGDSHDCHRENFHLYRVKLTSPNRTRHCFWKHQTSRQSIKCQLTVPVIVIFDLVFTSISLLR